MTTDTTALTVQQRAAVALSSSKAEAELIELAGTSKSITAITNKDGRQECHSAAMTAKAARISVEQAGKSAREDATAFSKAVIAEEKRLVDLIKPEEERLLTLRDGYDAKVKAEKEAAEAADRARIAAIKDKIELIKRGPMNAAMLDAAGAQLVLDMSDEIEIDDSFGEFRGEALEAKADAIAKLRELVAAKVSAEATAARIKAEQEAEAARLAAEAQRLATERAEAERQAAELRAAEEKRQADERARLDAERAEIDRQRQELEKSRREAEERDAADLARKNAEAAANNQTQFEQPAEDQKAAEKAADDAAAAACIAPIVVAELAARREPDAAPVETMKLGEICARIGAGFTVTADFLASLGIHPVGNERAAKLYAANSFPTICRKIQEHLTVVIQKSLGGKAA